MKTAWFGFTKQRPWQPGAYEVQLGHGGETLMCHWDGRQWKLPPRITLSDELELRDIQWRGLRKPSEHVTPKALVHQSLQSTESEGARTLKVLDANAKEDEKRHLQFQRKKRALQKRRASQGQYVLATEVAALIPSRTWPRPL